MDRWEVEVDVLDRLGVTKNAYRYTSQYVSETKTLYVSYKNPYYGTLTYRVEVSTYTSETELREVL